MVVCAKDAAKYRTMGRTALHHHHPPTRKRIVWPQMSRLKNAKVKKTQDEAITILKISPFLELSAIPNS